MKSIKLFSAAALMTLVSSAVFAQDVTLTTTNLTMAMYHKGNARNTGDFAATTGNIWNSVFMVTDGTAMAFADQNYTGAPHLNQFVVTDTPVETATSFSTAGMTLGSSTAIADITVDLAVDVAETTGATTTWAWTFNNAGASEKDIKVVWFIDGDVTISSAWDANMVGFTDSANNPKGAIALGTDSAGGVDLSGGMLMDTDVEPTYLSALANSQGPSYWWSNSDVYNGLGVEVVGEIPVSMQDFVEGDANADAMTDAATDAGMAMQWNLTVPAGGNVAVEMTLLMGGTGVIAPNSWSWTPPVPLSVNDWQVYD